jgi:uncharacterized protein YuzE
MRYLYDPEADCAYIRFRLGKVGREDILDDARVVDYGADGELVGVELLDVSHVPVQLDGLPRSADIAKLLRRHHVRTGAA